MKIFTTYYFFFISAFIFSQDQFKKGVIIDSVKVKNTKNESFSLYLPNSFNKNTTSPIVFIFDPSAKGKRGIKPFIKASEEYGLILVCSNNSENGSYQINFQLFNSLSSHILSNFQIKENEMYLAGFSGGSRLACAIASFTNLFTGVIACGAGPPSKLPVEYQPNSQNYSYVGICGNRDFNYLEMKNNKFSLDKRKFKNTLITYKDKHLWPNENNILKAVNWLKLQEIKKGNLKINHQKIIELYNNDYNDILNNIHHNELIFAAENYQRIINNYSSFIKTDSIKTKNDKLKKTKKYKKQITSLNLALKNETEITNKLLPVFYLSIRKKHNYNLSWWKKQLNELQKIQESGDIETKNMVYRIKFNLFATIYSTKKFNSSNINTQQTNFINSLLKLLKPHIK